jgi:phenylacetate-coenzyme A ligase PaaK-like adenylate-forming protein
MERMISELAEFKPDIIEANPSLLAKLCRYVTSRGYSVYQPKAIVLTYEYPTFFHYKQFSKVFSCPTVSSYGSTELGYVFEECECGRLHQNTEFCRVDLQPLAPEQAEPDVFRILTTTFNNPWYYLIRFDVSDMVRVDTSGKCPCGRDDGIIVSDIEGRAMNSTVSMTGKLITPFMLDKAISVLENVDEYRLDQDTPKDYLLRLVSERPDKEAVTKEATSILNKLYGKDANVTVVYEKAITPETSGKYRLSRANFPIEIENFLDPRFLVRTI